MGVELRGRSLIQAQQNDERRHQQREQQQRESYDVIFAVPHAIMNEKTLRILRRAE